MTRLALPAPGGAIVRGLVLPLVAAAPPRESGR